MMKIEEAKKTPIYYIDEKGSVIETTYYDAVLEQAQDVTSPEGCEYRFHIRHHTFNHRSKIYTTPKGKKYEVWLWLSGGEARFVKEFKTILEAEEYVFSCQCDDFDNNDSPRYCYVFDKKNLEDLQQ